MEMKIILPEKDMPTKWYNALPDLPTPLAPPLDPQTQKPLTPDQLEPIFPKAVIEQELSPQRWIDIPEPVLDVYRLYRPTPLVRARRLEEALGVTCRIYYKNESVSPAGSHKPNTAVPQVYYNKIEGVRRIATETGAGQWGTALSFACGMFGLSCTVYMVKVSYNQKPYRRSLIQAYGGEVFASPSDKTRTGRDMLGRDPDCAGSLGLAISEAVEDAATHDDTKYSLGSVLNHVLLHQTICGLETEKQLAMIGEKPDYLVGCVGGGSNFAGLFLPFLPRRLAGENIRFIAVEPKACPTLTRGAFRYDYGDVARLTPLIKMHTLGHSFMPAPIHAGGLRYHGDAPLLCNLVAEGLVDAEAYHQLECFDAARLFLRTEGFLPAPETAHAIKGAIETARKAKPGEVVVFLYSGHGLLDLASYDAYLAGKLTNFEYPEKDIAEALKACPDIAE
ncbi:TrpB-like pyridoxal phosphate-dependent enzyme [Desulfolutivibrio sulfoxidireducens]|uniref:TrpB-like pyridoxal phosphate-dependent enzyme n=1 Tax=Desulfolutivibrio sulfoxidireducens TaxID=2773299 RepID=UPI00159E82D4|nr:TrpB-like pyridoxal phosphate-dependent enzyme [Desulfolutivibrio sulfoxidireducens]QLA15896.1 TrpB-like pyridoxal phosphate-dependent enzyme [Desulfolutivibrio sulfoxidireducens]QLA20202.1 TrpB-like pyridoxal phosphate-dependent enzyme [Desulfolutivibrio sulfoxidireducens]